MQCLLKTVYLIGGARGNVILVSTSGDLPIFSIPFNHGLVIVLYHAAALLFISLADWLMYHLLRRRIEHHRGERVVEEWGTHKGRLSPAPLSAILLS